jgi:DNA-binding HxlR family transcriptional regulator
MKGKRQDLSDADCYIARALQVIGDWWSLLIVREAFLGRERFGEFQSSLGLAKNILSSRLKKLVDEGILTVTQDGPGIARPRYLLTKKGESLHVVLIALWQWAEAFNAGTFPVTSALVDNGHGKLLPRLHPVAHDGRPVGPRDFRIAPKPVARRSRRPSPRASPQH